MKEVPSGQWKDLPGGGEWSEARHDWDEERSREQKIGTGYGDEIPQFEQRERKAVRKTTPGGGPGHHENGHASAGPTPQKPTTGHHRNESWSSMSSAGDNRPKKPRYAPNISLGKGISDETPAFL